MKTTTGAVLGAMLLAAHSAPLLAQQGQGSDFNWSEPMAAGAWLRVHNHHGPVEVRPSTGDRVEVQARRQSPPGEASDVRFEVVRDGGSVTICALPDGNVTCAAQGLRSSGRSDRLGDASVAFTVLVPRGVNVGAGTGHGDVDVQGVEAEVVASSGHGDVGVVGTGAAVRASTGNGAVRVSDARGPVRASTGNGRVQVSTTAGPVTASSGNGDIEVSMASVGQPQDMQFSTGNGDIHVRLPGSFQGEVHASTGRGRITTDFPIVVQGTVSPTRLQGTIGQGGPLLRMTSGNGSLQVRRAD